MIQWTLETAAPVARMVEGVALDFGYHVALGGGVLYRGESEKDLDIFVYLHTTFDSANKVEIKRSPVQLMEQLQSVGFTPLTDKGKGSGACEGPQVGRYKQVFRALFNSRRVDIIFLMPYDN